ncbi:MAG: hypothetical protein H7177_09145, partial [Rhizobacter sp.]|nr:hypothetical protein [Bacteriovorax sp.]
MTQDPSPHLIKHFFSIGNETKANDHFFGQFSGEQHSSKEKSSGNSQEHDDELTIINDEVLNHLKTIVPELKFRTYFENSLVLKSIDDQVAVFEVKTAFVKKSAELYSEEIIKSLYNVLGTQYDVQINARDNSESGVPNMTFGQLRARDDGKPKSMSGAKITLDLTP